MVSIHIEGNDANELLSNLRTVAAALLGSASAAALGSGNMSPPPPPPMGNTGALSASADTGASSVGTMSANAGAGTSESGTTSASAGQTASPSNGGEVDAAGTPFDPERHTGTKVKSGLWRMKVGQSRRPGEDESAIPGGGAAAPAAGSPPPPPPSPSAPAEEDDEFAAFRAAAGAPVEASAPAARSWSDADLSKLCNQAAVKDGNPERVKPIIAEFIPAGEVPHSRNIPVDQREAFAQKVEQTIGIQFAG